MSVAGTGDNLKEVSVQGIWSIQSVDTWDDYTFPNLFALNILSILTLYYVWLSFIKILKLNYTDYTNHLAITV